MTEYTPRVWSLGEVCPHGSLGRQCETCAAQHELAWALAEVEYLTATRYECSGCGAELDHRESERDPAYVRIVRVDECEDCREYHCRVCHTLEKLRAEVERLSGELDEARRLVRALVEHQHGFGVSDADWDLIARIVLGGGAARAALEVKP